MQILQIFTFYPNSLKNSNFKFMRSLSYVYFWNLNCHISYLHLCNVNQSLKDENKKQKKLLQIFITFESECKRLRHFILVV